MDENEARQATTSTHTSWFYGTSPLSYTILLEEVLAEKKWSQKHGGFDAIAMTAITLFSW